MVTTRAVRKARVKGRVQRKRNPRRKLLLLLKFRFVLVVYLFWREAFD